MSLPCRPAGEIYPDPKETYDYGGFLTGFICPRCKHMTSWEDGSHGRFEIMCDECAPKDWRGND